MRTPRGVLLHWDPPELVPRRLDGYVLEGRQGPQGWEVLDRTVAGTEMQLLVPGLIKVRVGASCPLPSRPQLLPLTQSLSPDFTIFPASHFTQTSQLQCPNRAGVGCAGP